jgi:hypothetical protein
MASAGAESKKTPENKKPAASCDSLVSGLLESDLWLD